MRGDEVAPRVDARVAHVTGNEFFAERDGRLLSALLVTLTDRGAFDVGEQRQIHGAGECAECKFGGRTQIDQRQTFAEHSPVIGDGPLIHQGTGSMTVSPRWKASRWACNTSTTSVSSCSLAASTACCCNATRAWKLPLAAYAAAHVSRYAGFFARFRRRTSRGP
jgi:hypothetical protein